MPWTAADAYRHTHLATTAKLQRMWAHVANSELEQTGDDGIAVKAANSAVRKERAREHGDGERRKP